MDTGVHAQTTDGARQRIIAELKRFLARSRVLGVRIAEGEIPPPQLAYMVNFPRLSLTLSGEDRTELEEDGRLQLVSFKPGYALFAPSNTWSRPTWSVPVKVLTLLFGKRQTGISLVTHRRKSQAPVGAVKTHLYLPTECAGSQILQAMIHLVGGDLHAPIDALLVEAILHSCLSRLQEPASQHARKAELTYQNICLYLQEHFQFPLSRESVADHFRLSPAHISRLFTREGTMKFTDYLTWVRIDRAKFLLRHHADMTLSEAAARCGFSDTGYFCRIFKRRTKLTPTEYRIGSDD